MGRINSERFIFWNLSGAIIYNLWILGGVGVVFSKNGVDLSVGCPKRYFSGKLGVLSGFATESICCL